MQSMDDGRQRIARRLRRAHFQWRARRVLGTPPLRRGSSPLTVLTMLQPRDLLQYLIAIKSFHRFVPADRDVLVADARLGSEHLSVIRRHVPHLESFPAEAFRHPSMPVGGAWERLAAICKLRAEGYVVQLDADTITRSDIDEVAAAVRANRSFAMSGDVGARFLGLEQSAMHAKEAMAAFDHVIPRCEAQLPVLADLGFERYVRGCAGFSGFSRGADTTELLASLSRTMRARLGDVWSGWGSEQVSSNTLVARDPRAIALPHPKYCEPADVAAGTAFLHFVGHQRFRSGLYAAEGAAAIRRMASGAEASRASPG